MGAIHLKENEVSILKIPKKYNTNKILYSNHHIFENEITLSIYPDKIVICRATIDSRNTRKVTKKRNNGYHISLNVDVEVGRYFIDKEESNEDKLVIYLNN